MKFIARNNTNLKELFTLISEFMDDADESYFPAHVVIQIESETLEQDGDLYVIDDHKLKPGGDYYNEQALLEMQVMLQYACAGHSDKMSRVRCEIVEASQAENPDPEQIAELFKKQEHIHVEGQVFSGILSGKGCIFTSVHREPEDGCDVINTYGTGCITLGNQAWALCLTDDELDIREVDTEWEPSCDDDFFLLNQESLDIED